MRADAVIRIPDPAEPPKVMLGGQPMHFLVTGEHSKHASMFEWTIPAGFSTGRHVHRVQEETFYVLEGECLWQAGDRSIAAAPGTFMFVPPGVPHQIANPGPRPARVLMTVAPPGHEHYFEELGRLAAADRHPDPQAVAALRSRYDTDQLSALTSGE